jgi:transposase
MSPVVPAVGIDVSKAALDVVWLPAGEHRTLPNSATGWRQLITWLAPAAPLPIVLEATGNYHCGVVTALAAANRPALVLNPLRLRRFAQSLGQSAKTDRLDALVLAWYGQQRSHPIRPLPSPARATLRRLVTRREQVTKLLTMERNRAHDPESVQDSSARVRAFLVAEQHLLARQIAQLIRDTTELAHPYALLVSVPGIGPVIAATLLAKLPELGYASTKQLAALVGLAPFARDSGTATGIRVISGGRSPVRRALYQAVTVMRRRRSGITAYHDRLIARGKPLKVAAIATAHKLLTLLNAMRRDGLRWEQTTTALALQLPGRP